MFVRSIINVLLGIHYLFRKCFTVFISINSACLRGKLPFLNYFFITLKIFWSHLGTAVILLAASVCCALAPWLYQFFLSSWSGAWCSLISSSRWEIWGKLIAINLLVALLDLTGPQVCSRGWHKLTHTSSQMLSGKVMPWRRACETGEEDNSLSQETSEAGRCQPGWRKGGWYFLQGVLEGGIPLQSWQTLERLVACHLDPRGCRVSQRVSDPLDAPPHLFIWALING